MSGQGLFDRIGGRIDAQADDQTPLTLSDILDWPEDQRLLTRFVLRAPDPLTPEEVTVGLGWEHSVTNRVVGALSLMGVIDLVDGRIKIAPMQRTARTTPGGVWESLGDL